MSKKAENRIKSLKTQADNNSRAIKEMKDMSKSWGSIYLHMAMRRKCGAK